LTDDVNSYSRNVSINILSVSIVLLFLIKCIHRVIKIRNEPFEIIVFVIIVQI
jgi:hypothetical protein